jgi:hypothetical protein
MNYSEMYDFLKNSIKIMKDKTFFLISETGIGKSSMIRRLSEDMGALLIDRRLANIMPEDISGIPVKNDKKNSVEFMPIDSMSVLFDDSIKKPIFLFLDEMNLSSQEVLKAVFELVYDRTINGKPINKNTYIFAAGNYGDAYNVEEFSPALKRRMNYIEMKPDFDDWKEFAKNEVPKFIMNFLEENQKYFSYVKEDVVYSPAQWFEMGNAVQKSIDIGLSEKFMLNLMKSFIGELAVNVFEYYYMSLTLNIIKKQNIDYKTIDKDSLDKILETFLSSIKNGNMEFYLSNKQFVVDFLLYLDDPIRINEFVNLVGIENLDGLNEDCQKELLSYAS